MNHATLLRSVPPEIGTTSHLGTRPSLDMSVKRFPRLIIRSFWLVRCFWAWLRKSS